MKLEVSALVSELATVAIQFAWSFDGIKNEKAASHTARSAHQIASLEDQLNALFCFRSPSGELRRPLVLESSYTTGLVQTLRRSWKFLYGRPEISIRRDAILLCRCWKKVTQWVAEQLGVVQHCAKFSWRASGPNSTIRSPARWRPSTSSFGRRGLTMRCSGLSFGPHSSAWLCLRSCRDGSRWISFLGFRV